MKRSISLLLAVLMIVGSATLLFSCKKDKKDGTDSLSALDKQLEEGTIFYERAQVSDNLPAQDFGGREFRIVTHMPGEFFIEEEERGQGDLIKDAKYTRNQAVEQRFNTTLTVAYTGTYGDVSAYVSKTVLAGSDEFDLLMGMAVDTGKLVTKNLFLNWHEIPNINFDQPWWASDNKDALTVYGVCPIAVSDFAFSAISATYCMAFNKDYAASYELGDIYGLVLDGKWTFDKLQELIKGIYQDKNGNNQKDDGDFYGMTHSNGSPINTYMWAFDNPVCKKDEEGVPAIAVKTDKIDKIVNGLYDMIYNSGSVYYDPTAESGTGYATDMFLAGQSVFVPCSLGAFTGTGFRNFESDYGIIPYPKYDENQQNYHTMADGFHTVLAVPKTCQDTNFVGTIVEALSAETWKQVTPTFYEIALKNRYLRDDQSKEILDIIINGRAFDFGYIYDGWAGFSFMLQSLMNQGQNNFESYYQGRITSAKAHYKAITKAFKKMS